VGGLLSQKMRLPMLLVALSLAAGILVGASQAKVFALPVELISINNTDSGVLQGPEIMQFYSVAGVSTVWLHNIRAIILATLLGLFSFGVLGIIVLMLPLILVGYFLATAATAGLSPLVFFTAFVLPHGILEIPAIILAGAAILRLGATLATPAQGQTIGEALLHALADWCKVLVGLVIPLLLLAALLEVYLTPRVVIALLGG